jgi:hypothetical protein
MQPRRSLKTLDLIVIILALAVGLSICRELFVSLPLLGEGNTSKWIIVGWPLAASLTLALLILRFIPPRPRMRRLALQPGVAACSSVILALIWGTAFSAWLVLSDPKTYGLGADFLGNVSEYFLRFASFGVVTAWTILGWAGQWGDSPDWIERVLRVLGIFWIAAGVIVTLNI